MGKDENIIDLKPNRSEEEIRKLCDIIRQIAYDIHVYFGTGFLEKVYENALFHRLQKAKVDVRRQVHMIVHDQDGFPVGTYEADLIVGGKIILELKVAKALNAAHEAQLINYLKTTGIQDGILINFGSEHFEIIKRICHQSSCSPKYLADADI